MPVTYKILGQSNPSASTLTTVYTVPASTQAVVSSIVACNTGAAAANVSITVQPGNAAANTSMYVANNIAVSIQNSLILNLGVTLGATDTIRANCSTGNIALSVFGSELS